ncbi:MAG: RNA polymerase sigma factor [Chthoniobacterales bacterium]
MRENEWDKVEDWDLAKLAATGNEAAYGVLIIRHQNPIHSFIFHNVRDEETAKDLTQEVFIKAYFALARVTPKAKFTTWLFQIALNLCRDYVKSKGARQAQQTYSLTRDTPEGEEHQIEFSHPCAPPNRQLELSELMKMLDDEIFHLPEELRQPFLLGVVEKLPQKEIGEIMGISPKAVEVRIYRARKHLIEHLAKRGITENS